MVGSSKQRNRSSISAVCTWNASLSRYSSAISSSLNQYGPCPVDVDGEHLEGQETPTAGGVGEEVVAIHRGHKARHVGVLLHVLIVRHAVLDHQAGDQVLQLVFVPLVERLELVVDIDNEILPDIGQRVFFLWINLAGIAVIVQLRRAKQVEKRRLESPLFTG